MSHSLKSSSFLSSGVSLFTATPGKRKILVFSALVLSLVLNGIPAFSEEPELPFQTEMVNVLKNLAPIQTISLEYEVESKGAGETSFQKAGKYRLVVDRGNDSFHIISDNFRNGMKGPGTERVYKKGVLTSIYRHRTSTIVSINKQTEWNFQDSPTDFLFSYGNISENYTLVKDNKINFRVKTSNFQRAGKTFLKIEDKNSPEKHTLKYNFLFDIKTGLLAESNFSNFVVKNGKLEEEKLQQRIISDYASHNGFFFPADTIFTFCISGSSYHIKVDKKTIKIGEPVDAKEFDIVIPPGSKVTDSIKGTSYITPLVGNTGNEEKVGKELDGLFEEK